MIYYYGKGRIEEGRWTGKAEHLQYWACEGAKEWVAVDDEARAKAMAKKPRAKRKKKGELTDDKVAGLQADNGYTLDNH